MTAVLGVDYFFFTRGWVKRRSPEHAMDEDGDAELETARKAQDADMGF